MSGAATETAKLVRQLRRQGLTVTYTRSGHWRVTGPGVRVSISATPGDRRTRKNDIARLRRCGVNL